MVIAASSPEHPRLPAGARRAVAATGTGLFAVASLAGAARGSGMLLPVSSLTAFLAAAALVLHQVGEHHPHRRFGPANIVTLVRAAAAAFVFGLLSEAGLLAEAFGAVERWTILAIAVPVLALDGVDGFLARRNGEASRFGARFDMEVDAFLLLLLSLAAAASGAAGAWVIAIGLMRYLFWGAGFVLPWLARPLPPSRRRQAVCVAAFVLLIAVLPPVAGAAAPPLAGIAVALVGWSFGIDVLWTWRRRGESPAAGA